MSMIDSKTFYDVTIAIARKAGVYQKSRLATEVNIEFKGRTNLVTEVDKYCEQMIVTAIKEKFPDHDILAEEGTGERTNSPYKWVIDPLDGTTNFAHSYPMFAVSIALEYQGEVIAGVVYDPMRDELFQGFRGEGSFLNGKRLEVSKINELVKALLATGFAYNVAQTDDNNFNHFQNFMLRSQSVRRDGVASLDICYVACGRYDGFWELNLYPWDVAAAMIILQEAGGQISRFDGSPYSIYEKDVLTSNGHLHSQKVEILKQGMKRLSVS